MNGAHSLHSEDNSFFSKNYIKVNIPRSFPVILLKGSANEPKT